MTRLLLVAHALNASLRRVEFGGSAGLDPAGATAARRLVVADNGALSGPVLTGPAPACRETAAAFGVPVRVEDALADCDYGSWTGRTLPDLAAEQPGAVRRWLTDPASAPHGGESVDALVRRVAGWLDALRDDRVVAVTHAAVVRASLVHSLAAPVAAFWQLDVAPLATVRLDRRDVRWHLRLGGS